MTHDDNVERVARAIYEARPTVWAETREPTTMPSPAYETVTRPIPWLELVDGAESDGHYSSAVRETRHIAHAALSALPERAFIVTPGGIGEPSTIQPADNRELLREALSALTPFAAQTRANGPTEERNIRRARAAADKIRAALGGEKP